MLEWIFQFDNSVIIALHDAFKSNGMDTAMRFITYLGLGYVQVPLVLALSLFWRKNAWLFIRAGVLAFVVAGVLSQVLKKLVPRGRPGTVYPDFVAPDERIFYSSFPSGHTITGFAIAFTILWFTIKIKKPIWGITAIIIAALIGISRVYRFVHWPSDVISAALLGCLCGWLIALAMTRSTVWLPANDVGGVSQSGSETNGHN